MNSRESRQCFLEKAVTLFTHAGMLDLCLDTPKNTARQQLLEDLQGEDVNGEYNDEIDNALKIGSLAAAGRMSQLSTEVTEAHQEFAETDFNA